MHELIQKIIEARGKGDVMSGLLLAQSICRRRLLEEFDKGGTSTVLLIMGDIVKAMEELNGNRTES